MFTWIDALVLTVILIYIIDGYRRGFLKQIIDVLGIVVSFIIALKYYNFAGNIFISYGMNINLARPIGFFTLWTATQLIFYLLTVLIFHFLPKAIHTNKINRIFGILPGAVKGLLIVSIFLIILMILPFSAVLKDNLSRSLISGELIKKTAKIENQLEGVLGQLNNTLTFLGTVPEQEGTTALNFQTSQFTIDVLSEDKMVSLVNAERAKNGLKPLKVDVLIRNVARTHSMDMLRNGYFGHDSLSGQTPFDRLVTAGVSFRVAGENLALAPSVDLAHIGLMNSPSHRENILDPEYGRIGIGIMDAGPFGKMITQDFAD